MPKVATQIRLNEKLNSKLNKIAKNEKRSKNNIIEYFLSREVEYYEQTHNLEKDGD
jgi:predicted transcriptional regulator